MRIIAVDFGDMRTGIAVCDSLETLATPDSVIHEKQRDKVAGNVINKAKELSAGMIVIGLPVNMDGSEGERAKKCRAFADSLRSRTDIPITLWDERGSTITAIRYMNETDTRGKKRKQVVDAAAASIILQNFLDYRRNKKQTSDGISK